MKSTMSESKTPTDRKPIAVVTGAAGKIPQAISHQLCADGYQVIGWDIRQPQSDDPAISFDLVDVSDHRAVCEAGEKVAETYGKIDALVTAAGLLHRAPAADLESDDWQEALAVNLSSPFYCSQAVAHHMPENGAIVHISSYAGVVARPLCAGYAAAKAGLIHLTKCLALEWGERNIRVNAIAPGYIDTPMSAWMHGDDKAWRWFTSRAPLARLGQPEEIAGAVSFLLSPKARYITGETITIDGGFSLS